MTEREYQTPCYIIDEEKLLKDFNMLKDSLEASWNHYRIGYSFKTNSLPWLVTFLKEKGVMAEVVSDDEYALARWLAFKESEIIYNGPVKERTSFERALLAGGVASSRILRQMLAQRLQGSGLQLYFGQPELSSDNAVGVALIARDHIQKEEL